MFAFPEYTDYETMTTPQSSATAKPSETERKIFLCNRLKQTCLLRQLTLVKTLDAASCDVFRQFTDFFVLLATSFNQPSDCQKGFPNAFKYTSWNCHNAKQIILMIITDNI